MNANSEFWDNAVVAVVALARLWATIACQRDPDRSVNEARAAPIKPQRRARYLSMANGDLAEEHQKQAAKRSLLAEAGERQLEGKSLRQVGIAAASEGQTRAQGRRDRQCKDHRGAAVRTAG